MDEICLVPELMKFRADVTAKGAALYSKYLDDELNEKICSVPRRSTLSVGEKVISSRYG